MTGWQLVVLIVSFAAILKMAYVAGEYSGATSEKVKGFMNRDLRASARDFYEGVYLKGVKDLERSKAESNALVLEVKRLNKAITRRNRRIASLTARCSAKNGGTEAGK